MKIPLIVNLNDIKLKIVRNGTEELVPAPIKPFILIQNGICPEIRLKTETWTKVPENEEREYVRLPFNSLEECHTFRSQHKDQQRFMLTNSFLEQIYIASPDFFLQYPHTNDLVVMFVDLEVATKGDGFFPKPISNEILCIGYSIWHYTNDGKREKRVHKIIKGFNPNEERVANATCADRTIIREFVNDVKKLDPDIITGYNSSLFDFPYLIDRAKLIGESLKGTGRHNREMYVKDEEVKIPGRIHFDIYNSNAGVAKDQTLFGIKSRSLKELGRFYKAKATVYSETYKKWTEIVMNDTEVPEHMDNLLALYNKDPQLLYNYQDADIFRTEWVGQVYIRNCITLAEMLGVSLSDIMTMYSSFVPKLFIARKMAAKRLINTESNFQKYNSSNGSICPLGTKYEGALVGLYKDGFFPNVTKLDFSSMYPSSIQTWNLGPDTTSFVSKEPFTGKYTFNRDNKYNWYRIPDKNFKCDIVIKVRNDVDGLLKKEIADLRKERVRIKKEMKTCSPETRQILESQQYALKVILNSIYGVLGLKSSIHGDMMSAIMVTAMCRWTTGKVIRKLKDNLIELDSVTGDTPVYVYNTETKEIDIIPIEDLHNSNDKRKKYNGLYLVLTRNGWKKIKYTKRHQVTKNIYRVKISDGYVDVTEDHSLFNLHKKEITPKEILVNQSSIETLKENPTNTNNLLYGATVSDPNFCWLIGFLIAEGSVYEGHRKTGEEKRQVSFNGNNLKLMKRVENLANEHFAFLKLAGLPKKPHAFKLHNTLKSSAVYKVQGGYNKDICDFLKEYCYTKNRKDKKVPSFILNGTKEMKEAFLDGLMTGDGYKTISKDNRKIESIDSKFKSLSAGIRYLWNSLGIETICNTRKDKINITTYRKRVERTKLKEINRNVVTINRVISTNETVYDISTEDGTFVTALGNIVLHNTDGLILDKEISADEVNTWLTDMINKEFNIKDSFMLMESDKLGKAYFYAMKNYIVEEDGKYMVHGSSLKASRASKIVDRAIKLAIQHIFNGKPKEEVLAEALDFKGLTLEDFEERVKLTMEPREYEDPYDMKLMLSKQMELKTGQIGTRGTQFNYVICKTPLPIPELKPYYKDGAKNYTFVKWVASIDELDLDHYKAIIKKTLKKFGIGEKKQQLDLFGPQFEEETRDRDKPLDKVPEDE